MSEKDNVIDLRSAVQAVNNSQAVSAMRYMYGRMSGLLGRSHDGKRNIYDIYGYPDSLAGNAGFVRMHTLSTRQGVANRVTAGVAKSCWRDGFTITPDPEDDEAAELVEELRVLDKRGFSRTLEQADTLNRIGRFSLLLVGVPDGKDLDQPLGRVRSGNGTGALEATYFKAYAYDCVEVTKWVDEPRSPRYGLPLEYTVTQTSRDNQKCNANLRSFKVHHSRVVHMVENPLDSDVEGQAVLEPVFNSLLDVEKATGGASEAYFRNAKRIMAYEIDKEFASTLTDPEAKAAFQEGVEKFTNEMQDHTTAVGAKVKGVTAPHASPKDTVTTSLWMVSAYTGIPLRVLTGEGAGQLAGSEDQLAYNQIIADRQRLKCAGWVLEALGIMAAAGALELDEQWLAVFPPQQAATEAQQVDIENKRADTLQKVTSALGSPGGDGLSVEDTLQVTGLSAISVEDVEELPAPAEPLDDDA